MAQQRESRYSRSRSLSVIIETSYLYFDLSRELTGNVVFLREFVLGPALPRFLILFRFGRIFWRRAQVILLRMWSVVTQD